MNLRHFTFFLLTSNQKNDTMLIRENHHCHLLIESSKKKCSYQKSYKLLCNGQLL